MIDLKDLLLGNPPLTLSVAESITCGRIQARLGLISGASRFFQGGITTYADAQKIKHLGVDPAVARPGMWVSAELAEQMAAGACRLFGSDLAVATTGYAEPDSEAGIAHPSAFWALAHDLGDGRLRVMSAMLECPGATRAEAQDRVALACLGGLARYLRELRATAH
jgi:nicotinamide-nucleotide amidase